MPAPDSANSKGDYSVDTPATIPGQTPEAPGQTPPAPQADAPNAPAPKVYDEAYVKQLRAENADRRKAHDELERKLKAIEDEKLSDTERAQKRLIELEAADTQKNAQIQELTKLGALKDAAQAAGMANTKALKRLADLAAIELGADGEPTEASVKAAVAALKADYPELFGTGAALPASGGATSPGRAMGQPAKVDPRNPWANAEWNT